MPDVQSFHIVLEFIYTLDHCHETWMRDGFNVSYYFTQSLIWYMCICLLHQFWHWCTFFERRTRFVDNGSTNISGASNCLHIDSQSYLNANTRIWHFDNVWFLQSTFFSVSVIPTSKFGKSTTTIYEQKGEMTMQVNKVIDC